MSDIWSELALLPPVAQASCTLFPITDKELVHISGKDSAKFMQGQFTCNLNDITPTQFRRGACCNAKGRMIASFTLAQTNEDSHEHSHKQEYLMGLSGGLGQVIQDHLKKYKVFFKTQITSSNWVMAGLKGDKAEALLQATLGNVATDDFSVCSIEQGLILKLPFNAGFELWLKPEHAKVTLQSLLSECSLSGNNAWNLILIQHGLGYITTDNSESFIPQMINLGETGGISFSKGCYTGQEIVARMQYLGKLKRRLYRINIQDGDTIKVGQKLMAEGHASPVAEIVNITRSGTNQEALVVLDDKYRDSKLFIEDQATTKIQLLSLPYEITSAKE